MPGLLFFCFRSESGFGVSSSSSAQPFCSGILKPNAGKDSPTLCLGGEADFSLKWVLGQSQSGDSKVIVLSRSFVGGASPFAFVSALEAGNKKYENIIETRLQVPK
jgi:hypothetical protein